MKIEENKINNKTIYLYFHQKQNSLEVWKDILGRISQDRYLLNKQRSTNHN